MTTESLPVIGSCDGCGACCMHVGVPLFKFQIDGSGGSPELPDEQEWVDLPDDLKEAHVNFLKNNKFDDYNGTPCYWLDPETRKCTHYDYRPEVCRWFEMGGVNCIEFREELDVV